MKNKPFLILLIILFILSTIFSISSLSGFYEVGIQKKIELYPFGTEGPVAGLWHYQNAKNFSIYNLIMGILWSIETFVILISIIKKNFKLGKIAILLSILIYTIGRILENL